MAAPLLFCFFLLLSVPCLFCFPPFLCPPMFLLPAFREWQEEPGGAVMALHCDSLSASGKKREVLCISSVWNCHSWCSQPAYRSLWWTGVFGAKQALKGSWWFLCKHPVVKRTGDVLSLTVMELKLQRWHSERAASVVFL